MFDDATWHGDATHLTRYLRWASDRGLLAEARPGLSDVDLLESCDGKLTNEDFTEEGGGFTADYYERGHIAEFQRSEPEAATFRRLDARLSEWRRRDRSSWPIVKRPSQMDEWRAEWASRWRTGWAIAGVGLAIILLSFIFESVLMMIGGLFVIGGVMIAGVILPHLRGRGAGSEQDG
jgi:hypothetical protein